MNPIKVLITDDHALIREVWSYILNSDPRFQVVADCGSGEEAIEAVKTLKPNVVLMDINLPGMNGIETVGQIRKYSPLTKILGISMHTNSVYVKKMMQMGASGYVTKNSPREEMFKAIVEVSSGRRYICAEIKNLFLEKMIDGDETKNDIQSLSARELEITGYITKGFSSKGIAESLSLKVKTVEVHRHNILKKLKLRNTPALVNFLNTSPEHQFQ